MSETLNPPSDLTARYVELVDTELLATPEGTRNLQSVLRRQPPTSDDATEVGDLLVALSSEEYERLRQQSFAGEQVDQDALEAAGCRCFHCSFGVYLWYQLAITLDPSNSKPYIALARNISWDEGYWPGTTLEPLLFSSDEFTVRRVMKQYQEEVAQQRADL